MKINSLKTRKVDDFKRNVTITLDSNLIENIKILKQKGKIRQISPLINELLWITIMKKKN